MILQEKLPKGALVVAADAGKALFLRNTAAGFEPKFTVEATLKAPENPPTSQQGSDQPGRTAYRGRGASLDQTDWAAQGEEAFAAEAAETLAARHAGQPGEPIVLIAPPGFLGMLRKHLSESVRKSIRQELDKDYVNLPVADIERALTFG